MDTDFSIPADTIAFFVPIRNLARKRWPFRLYEIPYFPFTVGQTFRLPDNIPELLGGRGKPWRIRRDAVPGPDIIKAIATRRPVDLLSTVPGRSPLFYCRAAAEALPDVQAMVQEMDRLPPEDWSDSACTFSVSAASV